MFDAGGSFGSPSCVLAADLHLPSRRARGLHFWRLDTLLLRVGRLLPEARLEYAERPAAEEHSGLSERQPADHRRRDTSETRRRGDETVQRQV